MKIILPQARWDVVSDRLRAQIPEAFDAQTRVLNHYAGQWQNPGHSRIIHTPIDGSPLGFLPMLTADEARVAVQHALDADWAELPLADRKARVKQCLDMLREQVELFSYLLSWEIGKPVRQSQNSVMRCIEGVEWYLEHIDEMMDGRTSLGLVSNIASWNYPMSVLFHAMLVQALCGNSVIAKVPSDGGLHTLTLAVALGRRAGLPFTLVSGSGGELSDALIKSHEVSVLNYVGGKSHSRAISTSLMESAKRYMLEMEGVNAYGIWEFSDWSGLGAQIKKGYEYGKQRCTAYVRWVVQRRLFPEFMETYLAAVKSLHIGHPLLVEEGQETPPDVDFGPLINAAKVNELNIQIDEAISRGAVPIYHGKLNDDDFMPGQDRSAYLAPTALLQIPKTAQLYFKEPFGPVDTIVVVDSIEELIAEMNVTNGNLVSSIATDDAELGGQLLEELRAFKTGLNRMRSRGDRAELFGGLGQSWKGHFVGGEYLVRAMTNGPTGEVHYGNFGNLVNIPQEPVL